MPASLLFRNGLTLGAAFLFLARSLAADSEFKPLFNGRDLTGWDGNPALWSVSDGAIRGETTLEHVTVGNTFLIWRGSVLKDFELTLKVRIRNGNSGVQYRSKDLGKSVVAGYQMEVDNTPGKAGFLYEEKGRKYLALIGQKVVVDADQSVQVVGQLTAKDTLIKNRYFKEKDWNDYRIVARGNHVQHFVNGVQVVDVIDNDPKGRSLEGILALQIHAGPPMLVEFKDILLKSL